MTSLLERKAKKCSQSQYHWAHPVSPSNNTGGKVIKNITDSFQRSVVPERKTTGLYFIFHLDLPVCLPNTTEDRWTEKKKPNTTCKSVFHYKLGTIITFRDTVSDI